MLPLAIVNLIIGRFVALVDSCIGDNFLIFNGHIATTF